MKCRISGSKAIGLRAPQCRLVKKKIYIKTENLYKFIKNSNGVKMTKNSDYKL